MNKPHFHAKPTSCVVGRPGPQGPFTRFCKQSVVQAGEQVGQMQAVAAVDEIGLHMADDAVGRVHGQAAQVVQGPGYAGLKGDARFGGCGAVVRLVTEQPRLGCREPGTLE